MKPFVTLAHLEIDLDDDSAVAIAVAEAASSAVLCDAPGHLKPAG
jgi:hypothetical protein